jgi:thymidylate kinase
MVGLVSRRLATEVLSALDDAGIVYCVWKGSGHLLDSIEGRSDLDVLIDPARSDDARGILADFGFRPSRTAPSRAEIAVEDFLGIDTASRSLVHLHMYLRLLVGESHLERYRIPWERYVLETRRRSGDIFVADAAVEAVLVLTRGALRLGVGGIPTRLGISNGHLRQDLEALIAQTEHSKVLTIAKDWLGVRGAEAISRCLTRGPDVKNLARLRVIVRETLASQAATRGPSAVVRRLWRTGMWVRRGLGRRYLQRPVLLARGGSSGGLLVALVGADGSGKSTLARDLSNWFAPKLDTLYVYLGSGDGPASVVRLPMKIVHRQRLSRRDPGKDARRAGSESPSLEPVSAAKTAWALALAYEKQRKLRKAMLARSRGLLVICDRYPQTQIAGENDGPLLAMWATSASPVRRWLATWEARPYRLADRFAPDLVLRLNVDRDTAVARKPELDPRYLEHRIELVRSLRFQGSLFGVSEVDATRPYDDVFVEAAGAVWSRA